MIRVAVKFCGGCDPGYDRSAFWAEVKARAGNSVEWVLPDQGGYEAVLIIDGCETACVSEALESGELVLNQPVRVVRVKDGSLDPALIVEKLVGELSPP